MKTNSTQKSSTIFKNYLFISPPFGNYIWLPYTISIKGSYTYEPRSGLLSQILKTFRYSFQHRGWINKIGLRNKGIDYAIKHYNPGKNIISIAILKESEIEKFLKKIPNDMDLELNISCPNLDKSPVGTNALQKFLNDEREWCIIKLSPLTTMPTIDKYYELGFRQFHCSNTLPVKTGGLSGRSLIPWSSQLTKDIRNKYDDAIIISGGGIRNITILETYRSKGASHFSVSTLILNPALFGILYMQYLWQRCPVHSN